MTARFAVELTASAERDLQEIFEAVWTRASKRAAERLLDELMSSLATLEQTPERGPVPPELDGMGIREFRQLIVAPYRLIYRVSGRKVSVMLLADGRRDMQRLLQDRLLRP